MDDINDEDYWNTSTIKNQSFSFDDVDINETAHSGSSKNVNFPLSSTNSSFRNFDDDTTSELSFNQSQHPMDYNYSERSLDGFILEKPLNDDVIQLLIEEQSLDDDPFYKGMTTEDELRLLRRKFKDSWHAPPPNVTASKLLWGKRVSLAPYRSLQDKKDLLDEVIKIGDGDAILYVVFHLEKTLNKKYFNQLLMSRKDASNHYINYLQNILKIGEATDFLTMLGRDIDAAFLQFEMAVQMNPDPHVRKQRIKKIFDDYFTQPNIPEMCSEIVGKNITLLEWQLLEKSKSNNNKSVDLNNLTGSSPTTTLYYLFSKFNWKNDTNSNNLENPYKFSEEFKINEKLIQWISMLERCRSEMFMDLEDKVFVKTSWPFKQKQFHISVPLDAVVLKLHELNAPNAVIYSFLSKITDFDDRLEIASIVKCTKSIIDCLVGLREKEQLEVLYLTLNEGSEEKFLAENALKNFNKKKWTPEGLKLLKK